MAIHTDEMKKKIYKNILITKKYLRTRTFRIFSEWNSEFLEFRWDSATERADKLVELQ